MKISNFEELIRYLDEDTAEEKEILSSNSLGIRKMDNGNSIIINQDTKGISTSFPNEELTRNRFAIRRKYRYCTINEHRHEYIEIVYVLKGEFEQSIEGEKYKMKKGDFCIFDKNTRHASEAINKNHIVINILLTPKFFDGVFMHLLSDDNYISNFIVNTLYTMNSTQNFIKFHIDEGTTLHMILQNLLIEYFSESTRSKAAINGYLLILFAELSRALIKINEAAVDESQKVIKEKVLNYIRKNYKDINLKTMANYFNFHPSYLSNLIKKEFGKNLKDLLMEVRMAEACNLLENTNVTIEAIINEIGYVNNSYFYKIFKKQYGCTPIEYRNNIK
ncbi:AraC family transcriptional regulator [Clostridium saccharoperbutylacetonicum]